jgi:hypothetical protein
METYYEFGYLNSNVIMTLQSNYRFIAVDTCGET